EKRTVVERITLYVDGKKYQDDNIDEYDLSEYTGEEMPGEGHMEDHIATFNNMPEDEVIGHDILVKVEWKTGEKKQTEEIKLYKKPWYK
ncbi:YdhH/YoaO family protein, partial [Bacillus spizizenii]|nr:YdhH/YoaO family protein [Bacillus spizizenii]